MARTTQQQDNQGAARVSVATGSGKQDLMAEYDKRARALRGKPGVETALVQLKREFRAKGLQI